MRCFSNKILQGQGNNNRILQYKRLAVATIKLKHFNREIQQAVDEILKLATAVKFGALGKKLRGVHIAYHAFVHIDPKRKA